MAVFYPAVTGIMAGSNRAAEIANPSRSIPIGTILAVVSTSIVYFTFILLFGAVGKREEPTIRTSSILANSSSGDSFYSILFYRSCFKMLSRGSKNTNINRINEFERAL